MLYTLGKEGYFAHSWEVERLRLSGPTVSASGESPFGGATWQKAPCRTERSHGERLESRDSQGSEVFIYDNSLSGE